MWKRYILFICREYIPNYIMITPMITCIAHYFYQSNYFIIVIYYIVDVKFNKEINTIIIKWFVYIF